MCGEDATAEVFNLSVLETPPRVWGRLTFKDGDDTDFGNTPTCVGKTLPPQVRAGDARKHPHVCGEDPRSSPITSL